MYPIRHVRLSLSDLVVWLSTFPNAGFVGRQEILLQQFTMVSAFEKVRSEQMLFQSLSRIINMMPKTRNVVSRIEFLMLLSLCSSGIRSVVAI